MLATSRELMAAARKGSCAVGAFGIDNPEFLQAIAGAAEKLGSPAIAAAVREKMKLFGSVGRAR